MTKSQIFKFSYNLFTQIKVTKIETIFSPNTLKIGLDAQWHDLNCFNFFDVFDFYTSPTVIFKTIKEGVIYLKN